MDVSVSESFRAGVKKIFTDGYVHFVFEEGDI